MVGGIAVAVAERTFPFRVFSFPKEVVSPDFIGLQLEAFANRIPALMDSDSLLLHRMSGLHYYDVVSSGPFFGIRRATPLIPVSYTKLFPEAMDALPQNS